MELWTIIGPPAVGKLTVGLKLAQATGLRLLHNHLTFDLALSLHDYGTPAFYDLCDLLRLECLRSAATSGGIGVIMTFCAGTRGDLEFLERCYALVADHGWQSRCIVLQASDAALMARVGRPERIYPGKLRDPETLQETLDNHDFSVAPVGVPVIRIPTDDYSPDAICTMILEDVPEKTSRQLSATFCQN